MTGGRWQQVERLYLEAAARPPSERAPFLDEACGGDADLRREVERMLAGEASAEGFLEAPAVEVAARTLVAAPGRMAPGDRIGPYEIVSLAGSGGMGEVYKARDTRLKRTVAIKVLPAFVAEDPERRDQFLREARAASALSHPNIVSRYDIVSRDGSDSLVMEYLEGQTLDERIRPQGLPLRDVLRYAVQNADALAAIELPKPVIIKRDFDRLAQPGSIQRASSGPNNQIVRTI